MPGAPQGQPGLDPFQAFFAQGAAGVDPALLQLFGGGLDLGAAFGPGGPFPGQAQQPEPRSGAPPTSAATLRSLPKIKVTAYDIATNESNECHICLDDLAAGEPALRIPCGHLYHEECVKDWLKKSNECPVCRFELPTDDTEYEKGRQMRMAGRKIRMRRADLDVKSVQELQRLAHFIAVDVKGCLEKCELVERIAASPKVQIVQADVPCSDPASASAPVAGAAAFASSQLDAMSIGEVKALMERLGLDSSGCTDKAQMVSRLALSGRVVIVDDGEAGRTLDATSASMSRPAEAAAQAQPSEDHSSGTGGPLAAKSVGELRRLAKQHGVSLEGCLEKAEIVQRLREAPGLRGAL